MIGGAAAEQRFHNRERCRDALYALLRELSGSASSAFGNGSSSANPGAAAASAAPAARELLARLRPDNAPWLAQLLVARALAAALAGETDEEISALAAPGRLSRLHARMTAEGGGGGSDAAAAVASAAANAANASGGGGRQLFADAAPAASRLAPAPVRTGRPPVTGGGVGGDARSVAAAAAQAQQHPSLAASFAAPLRPFVLFLEAADSARLNAHLVSLFSLCVVPLLSYFDSNPLDI
jgi:hypothetical protein